MLAGSGRGGSRGGGRPPKGDAKYRARKIYLPPDVDDWARAEASTLDLSVSAVIALALAVLRKQTEQAQK